MEMIIDAIALPMIESSQAGEARRIALALASRLGFNEVKKGKLGIVVTEVANNLVNHAREGELILQALEQNNTLGIAILALDKGPGMMDTSKCFLDGFSTKGTLGQGLGAMDRLSDFWQIYSVPDQGTAILLHLWEKAIASESLQENLELSGVCLPKSGEQVSGDAWASYQQSDRSLIMVADGLGHGVLAAEASNAVVKIFSKNTQRSPMEIIELAHSALRSTRGAAVAIAEINFPKQQLRYAGVGNISAAVFFPENSYNLISYNGTVGYEMRNARELTYAWPRNGLLVMHSDGISTQWQWERYPGLTYKHPHLMAGVLYRDFSRSRDDSTVIVARERRRS
jgi:anti-sigma regulatory factor (Ser/Thr protein kinase)